MAQSTTSFGKVVQVTGSHIVWQSCQPPGHITNANPFTTPEPSGSLIFWPKYHKVEFCRGSLLPSMITLSPTVCCPAGNKADSLPHALMPNWQCIVPPAQLAASSHASLSQAKLGIDLPQVAVQAACGGVVGADGVDEGVINTKPIERELGIDDGC